MAMQPNTVLQPAKIQVPLRGPPVGPDLLISRMIRLTLNESFAGIQGIYI